MTLDPHLAAQVASNDISGFTGKVVSIEWDGHLQEWLVLERQDGDHWRRVGHYSGVDEAIDFAYFHYGR